MSAPSVPITVPIPTVQNSAVSNGLDLSGKQAAEQQFWYQLMLQRDAQAYNSAEAEKNRDYQTMMSNTAIARQVADIKAAGLNPWLLLNSGNAQGATSMAGSSAASSAGSASKADNKASSIVSAMIAGLALVAGTALKVFLG